MSPRECDSRSPYKYNKRGFLENGSTLLASSLSWLQIIVTLRRSLIRLRHEITPILVVPLPLSQCRRLFDSYPDYPQTSSLAPRGFFFRWLSLADDAYDSTNTSDLRYPYESAGHGRGPPSKVLNKNVHGRTINMVARRPPHHSGRVQRVSLVPHTRCSQMGMIIRGHLHRRQRQVLPDLRFLRRSGTRTCPPASAHCMDTSACRYSIMAATAQISRQSAFLRTTTAWEDYRT